MAAGGAVTVLAGGLGQPWWDVPAALAATATWNGGSSANLSDGANWVGSVAPSTGDTLVFPVGAAVNGATNDVAGFAPAGIDIVEEFLLQGAGLTVGSGGLTVRDKAGSGANIDAPLTLGADQTWHADPNATVQVAQTVDLGAQALVINGSGGFNLLQGTSGSGSLDVAGSFVSLEGSSAHTGGTRVSGAGILAVGSTAPVTTVTVDGGVLAGNGQVADVTANGGVVSGGSDIGTLHVHGDFDLHSGAELSTGIVGPAAGTQYDVIDVVGTVSLGDAILFVSVEGVAVGNVLTIVANDQSDAVTGRLRANADNRLASPDIRQLAEGDLFVVDGVFLRISYVGGDGNDVTLTVVQDPATTAAPTTAAPTTAAPTNAAQATIPGTSPAAPTSVAVPATTAGQVLPGTGRTVLPMLIAATLAAGVGMMARRLARRPG